MPLYDYQCEQCGTCVEAHVPYENRNADRVCVKCHGVMRKVWMKPPASGKPAFQMGAVTSQGQVIPGHFGKEAKLKRRK